jgi:hypothetical protein
VHVLDHEHGQRQPPEAADVALPALRQLGADGLWIGRGKGRARDGEADRPPDRVEDVVGALVDHRLDGGSQLLERDVARVIVEHACVRLRSLGEWPERDAFSVGKTAPLQHPPLRQALEQLLDEA